MPAVITPYNLTGLVSKPTCLNLMLLGKKVSSKHAIIEVGTFRGKSACCLAKNAKAHVYTVDPWDLQGNEHGKHGFTDPTLKSVFDDQVAAAGLTDRITHIQKFSVEAADEWEGPPVGLLFIDGDHAESSVWSDFEAWKEHLVDGAIVILDDVNTDVNPGVRVVFDKLDLDKKRFLKDHLAVGEYNER